MTPSEIARNRFFSTRISRTRQMSDGSLYIVLRIRTLQKNSSVEGWSTVHGSETRTLHQNTTLRKDVTSIAHATRVKYGSYSERNTVQKVIARRDQERHSKHISCKLWILRNNSQTQKRRPQSDFAWAPEKIEHDASQLSPADRFTMCKGMRMTE